MKMNSKRFKREERMENESAKAKAAEKKAPVETATKKK